MAFRRQLRGDDAVLREKDRPSAAHDYEVNFKAEIEIMLLHHKIDALRDTQWRELMALQQRQIELLSALLRTPAPPG